ncbi:MAG TPA: transaldolase [Gaiellaceae bacterium]|jgi:transaldolase|nr:transaldolase [Gaiellaceae bacterium]
MAETRLERLHDRGQSIWIDLLSRELVHSGELARLIGEDSVTGLTSNPSIFQKAIAGGGAYDDQIRECLEQTEDARAIFRQLAVADVRDACDVFRSVWDGTEGRDGYVSLEVDPDLAFDTKGTFEQAVELHAAVDRPNLYVKIPATREGLPAIEDCIARGIPINITLIFSLQRYKDVVAAYQRGLARLIADGGDASKVSSVASFFVSRLDTEGDKRLDALGNKELQGKLGIANAKLAYEHFEEAFSGAVWDRMAAAGATRQHPLWASTSTKNPEYRDTMYVEELIGPDTVNTMPLETLEAFRDHGEVRADTIKEDVEAAHELLAALAAAGVDYEDLVATLETEGVQKFSDAFDELIEGIEARRGELAAQSSGIA